MTRVCVHLILLAALWLAFADVAFDQQAAERDPWHSHIVLGPASEYQRLLAEHRHGAAGRHLNAVATVQPRGAEASAEQGTGGVVLSYSRGDIDGFLAAGLPGQVLVRAPWPQPTVNLRIARVLSMGAPRRASTFVPPPTPPPRSASW